MSSEKIPVLVNVAILILLVLGFGGVYYWLQYKPVQIRKACASEHLSYHESNRTDAGRLSPETSGLERYTKCLAERGL